MLNASLHPTHRLRTILVSTLLGLTLFVSGCSPQAREARYLESGKKMMEKKDYARAVIQFTNAVKAMPKDAEAHYQLALAHFANRNYQGGVRELKNAVELNPKHSAAQLKLAEFYATFARPDQRDPKVAALSRAALEESQKKVQDL